MSFKNDGWAIRVSTWTAATGGLILAIGGPLLTGATGLCFYGIGLILVGLVLWQSERSVLSQFTSRAIRIIAWTIVGIGVGIAVFGPLITIQFELIPIGLMLSVVAGAALIYIPKTRVPVVS